MSEELFGTQEGNNLPEERKKLVTKLLLPFYVRSSLFAKQYQKLHSLAGLCAYLFSTVAIGCVAIGILIQGISAWAFLAEFFILAFILYVIITANQKKVHLRWTESRFLTERIRSACFFAACGYEIPGIHIPPYLRIVHQPGEWMIKVFYEVWNQLPL